MTGLPVALSLLYERMNAIMSFESWHTYGYGICVSDIKERSVERLKKLLALAPSYQKEIQEWLDECEIADPTFDDFLNYDQDYYMGMATILKDVVWESEGVKLEACDDFEGKDYLLYGPSYPWNCVGRRLKTEEEAEELFRKYVSILTDEPIEIGYQSVENGG